MGYVVVYAKTGNGWSAHVPDLPGCIAAGRTKKETERLMREAIEMHLELMRESGEEIPRPSTKTGVVRV